MKGSRMRMTEKRQERQHINVQWTEGLFLHDIGVYNKPFASDFINGHTTIAISFTSLLEQIVVALDLAQPIYTCPNLGISLANVIVPSKATPSSYFFSGVESNTIQDSCEDAAKKAVLFFVVEKKTRFHDVNFDKKERLRQCRDLYTLKRHELDCIEKGVEALNADALLAMEGHALFEYTFCMDFVTFLHEVVTRVQIPVTPIECVQYGNGDFLAWITVCKPDERGSMDCIVSDRKSTSTEAKQSLARKALLSLMSLYEFVVEDVNFHQLAMEEFGVKVARENYLKVRERVHGLKNSVAPRPIIIEQDGLTPCGKGFDDPSTNGPSLPPKKRYLGECSRPIPASQPNVPHVAVSEELSNLAKHVKKE